MGYRLAEAPDRPVRIEVRSGTLLLNAVLILFFLVAPSHAGEKGQSIVHRWYTAGQAAQGRILYQAQCVECHGKDGGSAPNWHMLAADGFLPPPPLNGTGHTWHHQLHLLRKIIRDGGAAYGGRMPPFGDKLTKNEIDALIAGFQSLWPDEVYLRWESSVQGAVSPSGTVGSMQPLY